MTRDMKESWEPYGWNGNSIGMPPMLVTEIMSFGAERHKNERVRGEKCTKVILQLIPMDYVVAIVKFGSICAFEELRCSSSLMATHVADS
uniref:Uncharacterized protein n=1 Tax=Tanacetum cinerariifolium TaxID=118510 RepID=A0A6L2L2Y3_TANCI|nr:hypothetical protein [Tanacetum cinerariifolium]